MIELLEFLGLVEYADIPASELSVGQKKLLSLGRAIAMKPKLLLLDEPGAGLSPVNIDNLMETILTLKQRDVAAGLILIAADRNQLDGWINPTADEGQALSSTKKVITWVVTADPRCPDWITGGRSTCAVRITQHPIAAALCRETGMPLVSTSANKHGHAPAASALAVRRIFAESVDYILPGSTGDTSGSSEIRVARSGAVLRAG